MLLKELRLLTEARDPSLTYTEKAVKGKVEKIIVTLEGKRSERMTKIAAAYKRIDLELERLQQKRNTLNAVVKGAVLDLYDGAQDEVFTRVVETVSLTAQVSKLERPNPKVDDSKVIEALLKLMPELEAKISELREEYTSVAKPKNPALTVKIDNPELDTLKSRAKERGKGVSEGVIADAWSKLVNHARRFVDKYVNWGNSYDKKLDRIRSMMSIKEDKRAISTSDKSMTEDSSVIQLKNLHGYLGIGSYEIYHMLRYPGSTREYKANIGWPIPYSERSVHLEYLAKALKVAKTDGKLPQNTNRVILPNGDHFIISQIKIVDSSQK